MPKDNPPPDDRKQFQIALVVGGIAFAIVLGLAVWIKHSHVPAPPGPAIGRST